MTLSIRLDAVGGIAGDMFVAALLDARPDLGTRVLSDAAAVLPEGAGKPSLEEGLSAGLHCRRFRLDAPGETAHTPHATFRDMVSRIEAARLAPGTASHRTALPPPPPDPGAPDPPVPVRRVHSPKCAAGFSLLAAPAAGSIRAALGGAAWRVSAFPRGAGLVRPRHGLLPIPAPATALLLEGFRFRDDGIGGERVTPTGAAILRHLVADPAAGAAGRLCATGTGAGTRDLPGQPNILRASLFEIATAAPDGEDVLVLEFEVDDMTGEEIAVAADRLRAAAGVRDVLLIPALGKKGRPVQSFRLLADPLQRDTVQDACFTETATIGLRRHIVRRTVLHRSAATAHGTRIKTVARPAGPDAKAESDDLAAIPGLAARRAANRLAEGECPLNPASPPSSPIFRASPSRSAAGSTA